MKKLFILTVVLFLPEIMSSQLIFNSLLSTHQLLKENNNGLKLNIDMTGFFKNNEYFSPVAKGRTLPGISLLPKLCYQINNQFRTELGAYNVYYSGDQYKEGVYAFNSLFIRLQYAVNPELNLIFGNYYGGLNHQLIEPLYQWERQFTNKPESGLQLIYDNKQFFADTWVNWQRYIEHGDSVPEILTFGTSASAILTKPENPFQLSTLFQLLIHHQGGQINTSNEKTIVMGNATTGISSEWRFGKSFVRSIALKTYIAGYLDKLPDYDLRPYKNGWGIYPVLQANSSLFSIMAGYWYGKHFYAFEGEPLFGSFNPFDPLQQEPVRKLLTTKFVYSQQLIKALSIGAQLETYTDLIKQSTDYSFGIYLRFNCDFNFK